MKALIISILACTLLACEGGATVQSAQNQDLSQGLSPKKGGKHNAVAYFASGCFWCVEAVFESVKGVSEVESGYSGGTEKNPSYELICTGKTRHAEAVKVYYDSTVVSYKTLLTVFFDSHDPTTKNQQGPDRGPQYRSIIFYQNDREKSAAQKKVKSLLSSDSYTNITTEIVALNVFYKAEDYHQDYESNHPNNSYVRAVSTPRLNKFKSKHPELLK
jgi:peptide-methionine (S)-S-oxide reductase